MEKDNPSCTNLLFDSSSSSNLPPLCLPQKKVAPLAKKIEDTQSQDSAECSNLMISSSSTSSTTITLGAFDSGCQLHKPTRQEAPNIGYELSIAKSIMQQYSTLSGDNLFDHLSDIIKRVIDERPPNVIDFFEEFSRNVREQKFHLPERFPPNDIFTETRMFGIAKQILLSMKLPYIIEAQDTVAGEDLTMDEEKTNLADELHLAIDDTMKKFITFNERVQQLQFYWNQCGFSISSDDIFQLASAMNRLQTHPSIMQCRFWGCINGLKASYYIVEALLTREEIKCRLEMMEEEMREKQLPMKMRKNREEKPVPPHIGPELEPGAYGWEHWSPEEVAQMKPKAVPIPLVDEIEFFDIPPEYIGLGCNRFSYFVVNSLYDDWIELPIVTPRQIVMSRQIKKFLTGDLESSVSSYPCFPGKEKHYLRTLIARITAGTYIAPQGYYRRMTRREKRLFAGIEIDPEEEEEEEEEEETFGEEEKIEDNDVMLLKNEKYDSEPLNALTTPVAWVHVRPNILNQGRVVWFDEEKAKKEREKALALYIKMRLLEEMGDEIEEEEAEEEEDEDDEGEEEEVMEDFIQPETGPALFSSCASDTYEEISVPWLMRQTSKYTNEKERMLIMQSTVWPGAFTFIFENSCESIYLGWGHKYYARNIPFKHLPNVQDEYPHTWEDFIEASDPTVEEEAAYREWLLSKQKKDDVDDVAEDLQDFDDEEFKAQYDDNDDDDDEEQEE